MSVRCTETAHCQRYACINRSEDALSVRCTETAHYQRYVCIDRSEDALSVRCTETAHYQRYVCIDRLEDALGVKNLLSSEQKIGEFKQLEGIFSKLIGLVCLILIIIDVFLRALQDLTIIGSMLLVQALILTLYLVHVFFISRESLKDRLKWPVWGKYAELILLIAFLSTLQFAGFIFFVILLPLSFVCLGEGFRRSVPLQLASFLAQTLAQIITFYTGIQLAYFVIPFFQHQIWVIVGLTVVQYAIFGFMSRVWGYANYQFMRAVHDNETLVGRLGDKYVQLEEARREMQLQYDQLRKANEDTESSNKKLMASLAEFYTVQQIGQAINSIFDTNELIKFVNDVIIGVMGVSNASIILQNPLTGKMQVLASSIFDKRELAGFSDYINMDIKNNSLSIHQTILDNDITDNEYKFVTGRTVKSLISVPFVSKGKSLGIGLVEQTFPNAFTNENVRLLEVMAQQVSIAIDNARLYEEMQAMATVDGLTGAYNRISFQKKIQELLIEAKTNGSELAVVMCDIDQFKRFNDVHGHQFGDLVLQSLTSFIKTHLRGTDFFARYGGEEFVILMPHTSLSQAFEKAEDLRKGIARMVISNTISTAGVTISMGVAAFPETDILEAKIIKAADDALYKAKESGRNCVMVSAVRGNDVTEPLS